MKKVIIDIKGTQGLGDNTEVIEFSTIGEINKTSDGFALYYDEGEMMGCKNKTTLTVSNKKEVVLERKGDNSSKLIIKKGERNNCFYGTPYGNMVIGIYGENVEHRLDENGGTLKMCYTIDQNLEPISRNEVEISVRKAE